MGRPDEKMRGAELRDIKLRKGLLVGSGNVCFVLLDKVISPQTAQVMAGLWDVR